jgi:hypothetical protein
MKPGRHGLQVNRQPPQFHQPESGCSARVTGALNHQQFTVLQASKIK